ncbi:hypothetical protein [Pseudomonas fluorescens]
MSNRYAVILESGSVLPERALLVSEAWGSVPVSYVQDQEIFNECSFLDLKVNKWEVNSQWSSKQYLEPWIRIEKLTDEGLEEFLQQDGCRWSLDMTGKTLIIIDMDEGGGAMDDMLLMRLLSVFHARFKVYSCSDSTEELSDASFPTQQSVRDRLIKCE